MEGLGKLGEDSEWTLHNVHKWKQYVGSLEVLILHVNLGPNGHNAQLQFVKRSCFKSTSTFKFHMSISLQ